MRSKRFCRTMRAILQELLECLRERGDEVLNTIAEKLTESYTIEQLHKRVDLLAESHDIILNKILDSLP